MAKIPSFFRGWLTPALSPEQQILAYCQQPDAALLKPLIERYSDDLYHFLLAQSQPATAEDILQNTWLKVIEKHQNFKQGMSVKSWLFTIARNTLIDELRRSRRWDFSDIDDTLSGKDITNSPVSSLLSHGSAEHMISQYEQQGIIDQSFQNLLQALPMTQREAIILQLEGFSIEDIAQITSEKPETIKSRLRYAKQALKKHANSKNEVSGKDNDYVSAKEYQA
ncbi:RNA polymerase sigma factor [Thalassotalea litorea]|uniref:RNA polymerase sigma factor n=1 Tax=Thalassotalea litorea TaxID=2020715 RepID=UPI003735C9C8